MPIVGDSSKPTSSQEWNGLNTNNAMAQLVTMPAGGPWIITRLGAWLAGMNTTATVQLCVWSAAGTLVAASGQFTVASLGFALGNSINYETGVSVQVNGGQQVYVGFWRHPSHNTQNGRRASGSHLHDTQGASPETLSGWSTDSGGAIGAYVADYVIANQAPSIGLVGPGDWHRTADDTPQFSFYGSDPNGNNLDRWRVQLAYDAGFSSLVWDTGEIDWGQYASGQTLYWDAWGIPRGTWFYWRAGMRDTGGLWGWSGAWAIHIDSAANPPSLNSPASGTIIAESLTANLIFTMTDPEGDNLVAFRLQVDDNADFSSPVIDTTVNGSWANNYQYYYTTPALSRGVTYYWRVQAADSYGLWGGWSATWNFRINALPTATKVSPV